MTYSPNEDLNKLDLNESRIQDRDAKRWLENNDDLLYTAKKRLRLTYERLGRGILFLVFGGLVLVLAEMGLAQVLALLNVAFVAAVLVAIGLETWKGWRWFRKWSDSGKESEFRDTIWEASAEKISEWPHAILLPVLLLTASYGFLFSLIVGSVWFFEVVLPVIESIL